MASKEDEKRWRVALEGISPSNMSLQLGRIDHKPEAEVFSVGDRPPWPSRGFVEHWLREREEASKREETRRYRRILIWTIVAASASIVAAIEGLVCGRSSEAGCDKPAGGRSRHVLAVDDNALR